MNEKMLLTVIAIGVSVASAVLVLQEFRARKLQKDITSGTGAGSNAAANAAAQGG